MIDCILAFRDLTERRQEFRQGLLAAYVDLCKAFDSVNRLKWCKAPGICGIHAELLKTGGNAVLVSLHAVLCSVWNTGIIQTDWKRGLVVPLWKGKGDRQDCNNY